MNIEEGTLTTSQSLKGITVSFLTRDFDEVDSFLAYVGKKPLTAVIKPLRGKRSLTANGYYWQLLGKFRTMLGLSATEAHNIMLDRYGTLYAEDQFVLLPKDVDYLQEEIHYRPIPNKTMEKNGKTWQAYWLVKPSHLYDTKEFSVLIDGLVSECKEVGIETLPPHEIERLKEAQKGD